MSLKIENSLNFTQEEEEVNSLIGGIPRASDGYRGTETGVIVALTFRSLWVQILMCSALALHPEAFVCLPRQKTRIC